jgi:hypothetical protein
VVVKQELLMHTSRCFPFYASRTPFDQPFLRATASKRAAENFFNSSMFLFTSPARNKRCRHEVARFVVSSIVGAHGSVPRSVGFRFDEFSFVRPGSLESEEVAQRLLCVDLLERLCFECCPVSKIVRRQCQPLRLPKCESDHVPRFSGTWSLTGAVTVVVCCNRLILLCISLRPFPEN